MSKSKSPQLSVVNPEPHDGEENNSSASKSSKHISANSNSDDTSPKNSGEVKSSKEETSTSISTSKLHDEDSKLSTSKAPDLNKETSNSSEPGDAESIPKPPPRPKIERRESSFTLNLKELRSAFPDKDESLCRAILVAASNNLESAFTGILALNDPTLRPNSYVSEQISSDEQLARKLALADQNRASRSRRQPPPVRRSRVEHAEEDRFQDDPDLYDGIQRGFAETSQAVSSFWGNLKSRLSGELSDEENDYEYGAAKQRGKYPSDRLPRQNAGTGPVPHLPPRKPSRVATESDAGSAATRPVNPVAKSTAGTVGSAAAKPDELKSVNAFGDETGKTDENEPDAFFIGESDDDDLGSLNEETLEREAKKTSTHAKDTKASDTKASETKSPNSKSSDPKPTDLKSAEPKEETKGSSADNSKSKPSSAQELLSKVKLGNDK